MARAQTLFLASGVPRRRALYTECVLLLSTSMEAAAKAGMLHRAQI